jgi:hypothetical protein
MNDRAFDALNKRTRALASLPSNQSNAFCRCWASLQVVGAVGWNDERLHVPESVQPELAKLITSCFAEPQARPTFG